MVVESTGRHGPSGDAPELIEEIARPGISRRLAGVWLASALMTGLVWPIGSALSSDQALFMAMAEAIRSGATLYVDVWDNKQPGIFWFYAIAGDVFASGWSGLRVLYTLWLATAATLLSAALWVALPGTRAWMFGPVLTLGVAMLRANSETVGQVEDLIALPVAAIVLGCVLPDRNGRPAVWTWVAVGMATAVLAAFKLVLAPIAAAVIATTLLMRLRSREVSVAQAARAVGLSGVGFAVVAAAVLVYFSSRDAMPAFLWTNFSYPGLALAHAEPNSPAKLAASLGWLVKSTGLLLPAAALGAWVAVRSPRSPAGRLAAAGVAWLVTALVMIVVQKFSWWGYHMVMPVWPVGLLATIGLTAAASTGARGRGYRKNGVLVLLAAVWMVVLVGSYARKSVGDPDWPLSSDERSARATVRSVVAESTLSCRTVYAIGDLFGLQYATGLKQALPTHGIFWGAFLPEQAERLPDELRAARPDLLYIDVYQRKLLERRYPDAWSRLERWVAADYTRLDTDRLGGTWFRRSQPLAPADCPPPIPFVIPSGARPSTR